MTTTKQTMRATKAKATKIKASVRTKFAQAPNGPRVAKKAQVAEMLKEGTTVEAIVAKFECSPVAARALIGDVKRMGVKVDFDHGTAVYKVA
ncbi:hypothetical protein [Mesorhizobium marinum]|uniref:DUF3489 domain-containing protein n=1 Tax=Mesorhizobium marinum TaxID=3228790 RepID=A0ABV3R2C6_9HYPH